MTPLVVSTPGGNCPEPRQATARVGPPPPEAETEAPAPTSGGSIEPKRDLIQVLLQTGSGDPVKGSQQEPIGVLDHPMY